MPSFADLEAAAPALAREVRARLDAHVHKTIATVRRDGSPPAGRPGRNARASTDGRSRQPSGFSNQNDARRLPL